jgi:hypothetical protein
MLRFVLLGIVHVRVQAGGNITMPYAKLRKRGCRESLLVLDYIAKLEMPGGICSIATLGLVQWYGNSNPAIQIVCTPTLEDESVVVDTVQ